MCEEREMMVPTQEREHKKKCLLPDAGSSGAAGGATGAAVTPRGSKTDLVIFDECEFISGFLFTDSEFN